MADKPSASKDVEDAGLTPRRTVKPKAAVMTAKPKAEPQRTREPGLNRNARTSRAAQTRENAADPRKRQAIVVRRPLSLPPVRPMPGMAQRYVRVSYGPNDDVDNIAKAEAQGWEARKWETLSAGDTAPKIRKGEYAGYIGARGLVLMHRPKELNDQYRAANKAAAAAQMEHVTNQLFQEHRPGTKGLGRPKMSNTSEVRVRSRRSAPVQDDGDDFEDGDDA